MKKKTWILSVLCVSFVTLSVLVVFIFIRDHRADDTLVDDSALPTVDEQLTFRPVTPSTPNVIKLVTRPVKFPDGENATQTKGREILSVSKGKNKVPMRYIKDEILLKFHLGISQKEIDEILTKHNLVRADKSDGLSNIGYIKARIPDGRDVISVIKEIQKEHKLKIPEPNYIASILTISDPLFSKQWYVPDVNFDKGWKEIKYTGPIKLAVIDSGVDASHPDLKGKILVFN